MRLCINPNCQKPENADNHLFCQTCGSELLLEGRYKVKERLSDKGGFGTTYLVEDLDDNNQVKVLKVLTLNGAKAVELFKQEAAVLQTLQHPGIPKGYEAIEFFPRNSQDPLHCFVMQYIEGMDLEEYLKQRKRPIDQKLALKWLKEIAEILQAVHGANFFHRDIKPSNIMFQPNGKLALIDFGTAREMTGTYVAKQNAGAITKISSAGFTPPEQENNRAVPQSDFFALGRTFVYLLTEKFPSDPEIYDPYNDELKWREFAREISPLLADLIDELMTRKASERPQSPEVILQRLAEIESSPPPSKPPPKSQTQRISATVAYPSFWQTWFPTFLPQPVKEVRLNRFSFEVVKVNGTGSILKREKHPAEYFTEDLGNGVILDMVYVPGGTFMMGSPKTEKQKPNNEGPQHQVTVRAFFMGKYLVTQQQWEAVMGNNPSRFKGASRPVEMVNWNDAVEFCQKLSQKTGRDYRLPSEAEWEYACRAGTTTPFSFGETITTDLANYNGDSTYGNAPKGKFRRETTDVGIFPPNAFGLYDMHGNVWEWCADYGHKNYNGAPTDGSAWTSGGNSGKRLLRGGDWYFNPKNCRSAFRFYFEPDRRFHNIGFRLGVSLPKTS